MLSKVQAKSNSSHSKISTMLVLVLVVQALFVTITIPKVSGVVWELWKYRTDGPVVSVGVSSDGNYTVAGTGTGGVFLFDGNGSLLWTYHFTVNVVCVAISGDGSRIVVGIGEYHSGSPDIYLFDNFGDVMWQKDLVEGGWPCDVAISPDAEYIVTGDTAGVVYFYDVSGSLIWTYSVVGWVGAVSTSSDGEYTAAGSQDWLYFFDKTGNLLWSYELAYEVVAVSVSPEGEYVAAGSSMSEDLFLFDKNGNLLLKTPFYISIEAVSVSVNAEKIAVGAYKRITVIDNTANVIFEWETDSVKKDVAITADGKFVAFNRGEYVYFSEVLPHSEIECYVSPRMIFLGGSVTIKGSIEPSFSGVEVTLEYKLVGLDSTWKEDGFINVTRTVMTLANGSFTDVFTPIEAGRWKIIASWAGGAGHLPSEAEVFFDVNPATEINLLSDTAVTLYWHRGQWYCVEHFPSIPPVNTRHYFMDMEMSTSTESETVSFYPGEYWWTGYPEWGLWGVHTGRLSSNTVIEGGLWNLTIWASTGEPEQHFMVELGYWDQNHYFNFIASWSTGYINSPSWETPIQLAHSFDLPAETVPKGSFLGFIICVGPDSNVDLFFDSTLHPSYLRIPPGASDATAPSTSHDYDDLWHNTDFTITLTGTDDLSGVAETYYKINDGPTKNTWADGHPRISVDCADNRLEYWSVDNFGNEELPHKILIEIKLDKTTPTANAGLNQTIDEDTPVTFDGSASTDENSIASYTWTFTDETLQTFSGINPTYTFVTPGTYMITLNVTDAAGNWATDTAVITILDITRPVADAGQDQTVNVGTTVTFDAGGSSDNVGVVSYEWNYGDETTGKGKTTTHTYANPGTYTVTLTLKDAAGNTATHSITIIVLAVEAFPLWILGVAVALIAITVAAIILWRSRK